MLRFMSFIYFFWINIESKSFLYDIDHLGFECFSFFSSDSPIKSTIDYCLRPNENDQVIIDGFCYNSHGNYSFDELFHLNVTAENILLWSSSINLAEQYQYYIDHPEQSMSLNDLFCNCTSRWFGSRCQYSFESDETEQRSITLHQTCYVLLECERGGKSMCLDWREICDGRVDCLNNGIDELDCFQLEMNECKEDEYRCHSGLCIPKYFRNEHLRTFECIDTTDNGNIESYCPLTVNNNLFACEEHGCRPNNGQFSCGDGQCVNDYDKCEHGRDLLLIETISAQGNISNHCWTILACLSKILDQINGISCQQLMTSNDTRDQLKMCNSLIEYPLIPVLYGHVRFLYNLDVIHNIDMTLTLLPLYICYDERLCDFLVPTFHHGSLTCRNISEFGLAFHENITRWKDMIDLIKPFFRRCIPFHYSGDNIQQLSLYKCQNSSKLISNHRILDGISDCPLNDDEEAYELSCTFNHSLQFQCFNKTFCQSPLLDSIPCTDVKSIDLDAINFHQICNGIEDIAPEIINGQNHTDETDCQQWQCNNIYTRCDGYPNCQNGADEANCARIVCQENFQSCTSIICQVFNEDSRDHYNCIDRVYVRGSCELNYDEYAIVNTYCCWNLQQAEIEEYWQNRSESYLWKNETLFCYDRSQFYDKTDFNDSINDGYEICLMDSIEQTSFSLKDSLFYPSSSTITFETDQVDTDVQNNKDDFSINFIKSPICHYHGIHVRFQSQSNETTNVCFCRPNYYGDFCQYQNQRVSLSLVVATVTHQIVYGIVATLIEDDDNQQEIHSYHQFTEVPAVECSVPIQIYLLFAVRPKNISKNYSVRIDAFDKNSLIHLASWHFHVPFIFLPVNRVSAVLTLPTTKSLKSVTCDLKCDFGTCEKYLNEERFFCKCFSGWSGARCNIRIDCKCSLNSLCIGSIKNKSICVCPLYTFGSLCLLKQVCPLDFCQNNGRCIVTNEKATDDGFVCICLDEFFGLRCQHRKSQLRISFENIETSSHVTIYIFGDADPTPPTAKGVILQKMKLFQDTVMLYVSTGFKITFVKMNSDYYLALLQTNKVINASTIVTRKQRCRTVVELLDFQTLTLPRIQRIKHYHILCQSYTDLRCFIDEFYMCLCTKERFSNCFLFNQSETFICENNVYCENGGTCLQDRSVCSHSTMCKCADCFFGDRCQFYAKGIGSTLDDILRYVIKPNKRFTDQSILTKIGASFVIILLSLGLINNALSCSVFYHRNSRKVGCGMYLFTSSIISAVALSTLNVKFWIVLLSYMNQSVSRSLLRGGCVIVEPLLKFGLIMNNWLNAFVAIERAITVFQGVNFDRDKSKSMAKWVILLMPFIILGSLSYEFILRDLFDDEEEKRTWCVVFYSSAIEHYSSIILLIHFLVPFFVNMFSALFVIFTIARQHNRIQAKRRYNNRLRKQFSANKQLIISPVILMLLSFPHLLISLLSGCVKESRNSWLYLSGYFISFLPSAFGFVIFVLPSNLYRRVFNQSAKSWREWCTSL